MRLSSLRPFTAPSPLFGVIAMLRSALLPCRQVPVLADDLGSLLWTTARQFRNDILAGQRGGTAGGGPLAVVKDNVAITGANNSVNEVSNSMNGAAGLFNVVQNSGNNVAIQSQITVNANLH